MAPPPFLAGKKRLTRRASNAVQRRVYYDPDEDREYEKDKSKGTWHEIDPTSRRYRDVDRETGKPLAGGHGEWRDLK